jgi:hypothetical protein
MRTPNLCIFFLAAVSASVNGQEKLVPAKDIPDEVAYTILFNIVRDAPPPHWDRETCRGWLQERGFRYDDAEKIIQVATEFHEKQRATEAKLVQLDRESHGSLSTGWASERARLGEEISEAARDAARRLLLLLNQAGRLSLPETIQDIRAKMKMSDSLAYTFYTTATTPNTEYTATVYTSVGAAANQCVEKIGVMIKSPAERTATAHKYPSWPSAQATAYLPLCYGANCEDGTFYVNTVNKAGRCSGVR